MLAITSTALFACCVLSFKPTLLNDDEIGKRKPTLRIKNANNDAINHATAKMIIAMMILGIILNTESNISENGRAITDRLSMFKAAIIAKAMMSQNTKRLIIFAELYSPFLSPDGPANSLLSRSVFINAFLMRFAIIKAMIQPIISTSSAVRKFDSEPK